MSVQPPIVLLHTLRKKNGTVKGVVVTMYQLYFIYFIFFWVEGGGDGVALFFPCLFCWPLSTLVFISSFFHRIDFF